MSLGFCRAHFNELACKILPGPCVGVHLSGPASGLEPCARIDGRSKSGAGYSATAAAGDRLAPPKQKKLSRVYDMHHNLHFFLLPFVQDGDAKNAMPTALLLEYRSIPRKAARNQQRSRALAYPLRRASLHPSMARPDRASHPAVRVYTVRGVERSWSDPPSFCDFVPALEHDLVKSGMGTQTDADIALFGHPRKRIDRITFLAADKAAVTIGLINLIV
jgi:hypothetical protein